MSRHDYVAFVRTSRATMFSLAVDGCAKEMGTWVLTGCVDVVVFGIFAHLEGRRRLLYAKLQSVNKSFTKGRGCSTDD